MDALIMTIIENIMIILVTLAAGFIVAFIRKRIGTEGMQKVVLELALKQELAELGVKFVEQVYRDYDGEEKYTMAAIWLADRIGELGLEITESEVKGLIESALRTLKDEFGEQWAKTVSEP